MVNTPPYIDSSKAPVRDTDRKNLKKWKRLGRKHDQRKEIKTKALPVNKRSTCDDMDIDGTVERGRMVQVLQHIFCDQV